MQQNCCLEFGSGRNSLASFERSKADQGIFEAAAASNSIGSGGNGGGGILNALASGLKLGGAYNLFSMVPGDKADVEKQLQAGEDRQKAFNSWWDKNVPDWLKTATGTSLSAGKQGAYTEAPRIPMVRLLATLRPWRRLSDQDVSVDGRPVSRSNPLPVQIAGQSATGGGFWDKVGSFFSGLFGVTSASAATVEPTGGNAGEKGWWTAERQKTLMSALQRGRGLSDAGARG